MKKQITAIMLAACLMSACAPQSANEPEQKDTPTNATVRHEISDSVATDGYNALSECEFDFDGDGEDDTLTLYTTAEVENGEILYDDGQHWMLVCETAEGAFNLYDEYIQLGAAEIDVGEIYNDDPEKLIILTLTTGAGKTIIHYTFRDGGFSEEQVYSTDDYSKGGANIIKSLY